MKKRWKKIRYRLELFCLELLVRFMPLLPRRAVVVLANGLGTAVYYCDKRGRRLSLANIKAAFGDRYSPGQRIEIARASFRDFSRTMLDLFWAPALTPENYRRYMDIQGIEVLRKLRDRGESAIIMCIHHGNFEWASLAAGFEGFPTTIVMEEFKNPLIGRFFKDCREVSGHRVITQQSSMIRLLKHAKKGGFSGMLVDLNCKPGEAATVIDTFGMAMCVTFLHTVLAQRGGARLVPLEGRSQPDGSCRVIFHEPLEVPPGLTRREFTQFCWNYFEPIIRERPHQWMWAYRHWRFKPRNAAQRYPFYAGTNLEFDRLFEKVAAEEAAGKGAADA